MVLQATLFYDYHLHYFFNLPIDNIYISAILYVVKRGEFMEENEIKRIALLYSVRSSIELALDYAFKAAFCDEEIDRYREELRPLKFSIKAERWRLVGEHTKQLYDLDSNTRMITAFLADAYGTVLEHHGSEKEFDAIVSMYIKERITRDSEDKKACQISLIPLATKYLQGGALKAPAYHAERKKERQAYLKEKALKERKENAEKAKFAESKKLKEAEILAKAAENQAEAEAMFSEGWRERKAEVSAKKPSGIMAKIRGKNKTAVVKPNEPTK